MTPIVYPYRQVADKLEDAGALDLATCSTR